MSIDLKYNQPALTNPVSISLTPTQAVPTLDVTKDYIIRMPNAVYTRNVSNRSLVLNGGRNVVLVGGEVNSPAQRAVYIVGNKGTVFIEGLKISGSYIQDAFTIDSRFGGTVIIQNCSVPDGILGSDAYHADLIQSWAGPAKLCIDHFYGRTNYQGFFLVPNNQWSGWTGTDIELSNVLIETTGVYALWVHPETVTISTVDNVRVETPELRPTERDWRLWPKSDPRWDYVDIAPFAVSSNVGIGYTRTP